ncbi:MAG: HAMP domain-containing histidine kinase [Planctomycetota bacterium]|jgi:signal transduction histidine kinase|nr:HAMP domain-containing histidine kinase [Planctomycetota bacterium]
MKLRQKIIFSFLLMTIIHGMATLLLLETYYLVGGTFHPENGDPLIAPGLFPMAASLGLGIILNITLLFLSIRRLVLDPLDELRRASSLVAAGEAAFINTGGRQDEIGQLGSAFNYMAGNIIESRLHLQEKIRLATDKIERTQRELAFTERLAATGRLAAGVAHEINNPLAGVMNAVSRIRREAPASERTDKYLDICDNGLKRIQETVRRILDFSRKRREIGLVVVTRPLLQALELIRHLLDAGRITARVNIADDGVQCQRMRVKADAGDLQHVFLNLLVNAVDAMPDGGVLTLNAYRAERWVVVEIIDTGGGLTIEEVSASFDYFHTTKPVGKGTGLGLSIAHHIVVGYGGALTLNSEKGVGTKAAVELPAAESAPEKTTKAG